MYSNILRHAKMNASAAKVVRVPVGAVGRWNVKDDSCLKADLANYDDGYIEGDLIKTPKAAVKKTPTLTEEEERYMLEMLIHGIY